MVLIFYFLLRNLLFLRNNIRHCQGSHWEYFIKPLSAASRFQKVFTLPGRPDIIKQFVMYELKWSIVTRPTRRTAIVLGELLRWRLPGVTDVSLVVSPTS
jgi:hypothetical protein